MEYTNGNLGDATAYAKSAATDRNHIRTILPLPRKCCFGFGALNIDIFESPLTYLGHVLRSGRLWDPLIRLTKALQRKLILPSVLVLPRHDDTYNLITEGCTTKVGYEALLVQRTVANRSIGYWTCRPGDAQHVYHVKHRKICAVWSVPQFRSNIEKTKYTIPTNYDCWECISILSDAIHLLARLWFPLSEINFNGIHEAVITNQAENALSNLEAGGRDSACIKDELLVAFIDLHEQDSGTTRT